MVVDNCRFFMRWLYVVVDGFRWLQMVLGGCRWF